ncbi:Exopolyphosphatase [Pseudorhizobium banfieldiae]|uniref:Exopolyphosphatase n=1 Tax=Pseudorhizobium banfieldiae TaxID=1125847 RepID=L0NCQ1_9HYPH|nr:Ppx/GppA phosphatase family protein [Pseudorhizobium banfieldiae]CAD6600660.1 Ppx/GppA family phosphatase [arsenite-oxidising bacterium NT-25]CAD6605257.1 Ppx/GppA family phosphatase [Rhizobium sp. TCK]CCF18102.1 Exopolyphosphatase [Pseudorhizobium banfieldiae]
MDPEGGGKPQQGGASAEGRGDAKTRRRRAKRNGKRRHAAPSMHGGLAQDAGQGHVEPSNAESPKRKRKRRRVRSASTAEAMTQATAGTSASRRESTDVGTRGDRDRTRKRRKKNPHGRELQGRPLAQPRHAPAYAPEKAVTASAYPQTPQVAAEPSRPSFRDDYYAALDLGTNNCRLLVAQPTRPGQFRVVDAFSRIVRLGEGLAANRRLSNEAMDRAVEALKVCAAKLSSRPIRKMRLIATEACRAAENGEEFLDRVVRETSLTLEIIDRETEARLAVSGCSSLVGREARSVVLFDIGGGSSEIAVIRIGDSRSNRLANHITHWTSLPVGVVTLSERHGGRDVTPDVFAGMVAEVEDMLARFEAPPVTGLHRHDAEGFHLIGTSGTVTTLAGVHLDLPRYDRRKVDGLWLSDAEVSAMQAKLLSWDFAGRAANPCIGPDRADLVLAGCAILEAIRRRWPSPRMRVADRGLREGILTDMMADDGAWRRSRPRRDMEWQGEGKRR